MTITTTLTSTLSIQHPIVLAPMGGISGGILASAVSNAGGLGLIGGGYGDKTWLERELLAAGSVPIGVGFISWSLQRNPDLLNLVLAHNPKALFLSFGDIRNFAPQIKRSATALIVQVQTVSEARAAADDGADIIVAQGTEAGGHCGTRATFPLVPAIVDAIGNIPVIAAGGIADGRGLAAALMLGAAGILCGTAFFASRESLAHPHSKSAALAGLGDNTLRSSVIDIARNIDWPEEWKIRTLQNSFTQQWDSDITGLQQSLQHEQLRYAKAHEMGDTNIAAVIVGEAVDLVHDDESAETIVHRIISDAEVLLNNALKYLS